jgi:hypothetical protein
MTIRSARPGGTEVAAIEVRRRILGHAGERRAKRGLRGLRVQIENAGS